MTDEPKVIWAITQYRGVFGATGTWREVGSNDGRTPYIRLDAPELLAMVDALRAMRDMAKIGKPMVATEIKAAADQAAAAITAWEKLTK